MKIKTPVCSICLGQIDLKREYSTISDWEGSKEVKKIYLHQKCFRDRFNTFLKLQKLGEGLFANVGMVR